MKLISDITVFPLISTVSLYLISNSLSKVLIRGQRLKKDGAYFIVRDIHHIKFLASAILAGVTLIRGERRF